MAVVRYAWFEMDRFFGNDVFRIVIELVSTIGGVAGEPSDTGDIGGVKSASFRSPYCDTELSFKTPINSQFTMHTQLAEKKRDRKLTITFTFRVQEAFKRFLFTIYNQ